MINDVEFADGDAPLEKLLEHHGAGPLILTGIGSAIGVLTTADDANMYDLHPNVPANRTASIECFEHRDPLRPAHPMAAIDQAHGQWTSASL